MQRRKFIKNTLTSVPALLMPPALLASSCNKNGIDPKSKTVIIIGAGISGLVAAKKLKQKGFNVLLLEAQDKVGGRLRTNRSLGISFDEGASWIHGVNGNPITMLAQQAGMTTFETVDESRKSYDIGGVLRSAATYDKAETELDTILNTLMKSGNANQSFETVFNTLYPAKTNDRLWKFLLHCFTTRAKNMVELKKLLPMVMTPYPTIWQVV
jgi:monoamine oxidase